MKNPVAVKPLFIKKRLKTPVLKKRTMQRLSLLMLLLLSVAGSGQQRHLEFENIYRQIKDKNFFKARDIFRETKKKLPADYLYLPRRFLTMHLINLKSPIGKFSNFQG